MSCAVSKKSRTVSARNEGLTTADSRRDRGGKSMNMQKARRRKRGTTPAEINYICPKRRTCVKKKVHLEAELEKNRR